MTSEPSRADLRKRLEFSERRRMQLTRALSRNTPDEDGLLWSIADLMTLLLIFFVVFHGHGARERSAIALSVGPPAAQISTPLPIQLPANPPQAQPEPTPTVSVSTDSEVVAAEGYPGLDRLASEVQHLLGHQESQAFSIRGEAQRPVIVLGEQITFDEGHAKLLTEFLPVLTTIAQFLNEHRTFRIQVAGHTDTTPIHNATYPSNWELSATRAVNVARFLIHRGVNPARVSIEGFAEYQPIEANITPDQRQMNRRVEITLLKSEV